MHTACQSLFSTRQQVVKPESIRRLWADFFLSLQNWSGFQTRTRNHKPRVSVLFRIVAMLLILSTFKWCPEIISIKIWEWSSPEWPLLPPVTLYQPLCLNHNSQLCLHVALCWKVSSCSSSHSCTPQPFYLLPQGQVSEAPWMSPADDRPIDTSVWSWKWISLLHLKQECFREHHPWTLLYLSDSPQAKIEKYFSIYPMSKIRGVRLNCTVVFQSRRRSFWPSFPSFCFILLLTLISVLQYEMIMKSYLLSNVLSWWVIIVLYYQKKSS